MAEEQKIVIEQDKKKLYVKWDITGDQLKETFAAFGATEARVIPTSRIRPFAFISFGSEADAAKAMAAMQGKSLTSQPLMIEYASAAPRAAKAPKVRAPKAAAVAADGAAAAPVAAPKKAKKAKAAAAAPAAGSDASPSADAPKVKKPRVRRPKNKAAAVDGAEAPAADAAADAAPAAEEPKA